MRTVIFSALSAVVSLGVMLAVCLPFSDSNGNVPAPVVIAALFGVFAVTIAAACRVGMALSASAPSEIDREFALRQDTIERLAIILDDNEYDFTNPLHRDLAKSLHDVFFYVDNAE